MESSSGASHLGKRKQSPENAAGPAWGAQSFSATKNSAINKAMKESGKDPGFGDFGRYFSEKKRKLRDQYHGHAAASFVRGIAGTEAPQIVPEIENKFSNSTDSGEVNKQLFKGVSIFVDGFTTPTHQELRLIMMKHGGIFENYFSSQRVTHIICSTLPDSKIMNPRLMSRGVPIVKPEWIVDSMKESRLLPWDSYQLERIAYSHPHQRTLSSSFAACKSNKMSPVTIAADLVAPIPVDVDNGNPVNVKNEVVFSAADSVSEPDKGLVTKLNELETHRGTKHDEDVPDVTGLQRQAKEKVAIGRGRSTLDDPDFVHSYFKNSRLHFIGTWRNRYQSLVNAGSFGNPSPGFSTDRALPMSSPSGTPVIIHLDMDCFFVSVIVRNRPGLAGKPVAVCHSDSAQGTGEISSANYPARSYGVKAGMFVRDAKARCPELSIVPYDFAAYEQVADMVYSILHNHCSTVQAVSCDEAFLDVTGHPDPTNLASRIREEIFQATQCTASAGIAENLLLARLATKKAKPNGQFVIQPNEVKEFIAALPVDQLPGVGWTLREKLHGHGLYICADLQSIPKEVLQRDYGAKTGVMLWSYAQGIDEREVQPAQERKSIGAEVNWGVRFSCMDDAQQFLFTLSNEVAERMQKASSSGRTITLKVKKRKEGIGEPVKFMGCGPCDNLSRSETVGYATNSAEILLRISWQLFASLHLDVQEVRGVGLQVSRLESVNTDTRHKHNVLDSWFAPATNKLVTGKGVMHQISEDKIQFIPEAKVEQHIHIGAGYFTPSNEVDDSDGLNQRQDSNTAFQLPVISSRQVSNDVQMHNKINSGCEKKASSSLELPSLSQLDQSVLDFLPADIVAEIKDASKAQKELRQKEHLKRKVDIQPCAASTAQRPSGVQLQKTRKNKSKPRNSLLELPPRSQLDPSVLESLPKDILAEINHAYEQELLNMSPRRESASPPSNFEAVTLSAENASLMERTPINIPGLVDRRCGSSDNLNQFESISSKRAPTAEHGLNFGQPKSLQSTKSEDYHALLQSILESVNSGQSPQTLSSAMLSLGCYIPIHDSKDVTGLEQSIHQCFRLLIEYVQAIASKDLEEAHLVVLYTKRLGSRCKFWRAVQELAMPVAKDVIGDLYGGQLAVD